MQEEVHCKKIKFTTKATNITFALNTNKHFNRYGNHSGALEFQVDLLPHYDNFAL